MTLVRLAWLIGVALLVIGGVILINGLLAILLIWFAQAMGWWEVRATDRAPAGSLISGAFSAIESARVIDGS